ncbi:NADH:ubiquinone reductase (Na(+)-transporting) subunit C [Simkania negevensis]|uniref:Na(+)-translocating NADH-quinone reductase subunit C n=1 Tax=Simkania negevensis (strain ATCC VR-1471 / DSM 27360 / Z) TaxID=331113 RepID=F8L6K6_SIMNZ|nr:NADH:ubiquinone reductase (Na(+)-transporting) subunit C [Simkania negevensis]CCB88351.1 putative Na(+)-translocating NADH-quinone reductase subunit C [Simkania negevensis Z]
MVGKERQFTSGKTLLFVVVLCFTCALVLSVLADLLKQPQLDARELYKSKQLLRAAAILSNENVFLLNGTFATYDEKEGILVATPNQKRKARDREILALFEKRVLTRVTNAQGDVLTFEEAGLDQGTYLQENAKYGFANLPYKLVYIIQPNIPTTSLPYGYVIPINGYGLWDAIYGYLGLKADADTVLGMTWYDQKETPGLGGNIALPHWQGQFQGKVIFQESPSGQTNYARAQLGIKVVKTTVEETYGDSYLAKSAVDGIAGASITVIGVNEALRKSLEPYRPFLIRAHEREVRQ